MSTQQLIQFGSELLEGRNYFNKRQGAAVTPVTEANAIKEAKLYLGYNSSN